MRSVRPLTRPLSTRPSAMATTLIRKSALTDGARVDDVLEQVIEVGPAGAGEVGADVAAVAVEPVARGAGLLEDGATLAPVGRGERLRRRAAP